MSQAPRSPAIDVWLATPDAAREFDPSKLSLADRAAWDALHSDRRRLDWASSRALLGVVPIAGDQASSVSHSHGFAALARSPGYIAVGVDVEWLTPRDFRSLARTAYSAAEADEFDALEDPSVLPGRFYETWTLKEAFAKALRLSLADALGTCCFTYADGIAKATVPTSRHWRAAVFAPRPQLRLAIVLVADAEDALAASPATTEWPPARAANWPVVRRLSGGGERTVTC
jgi:phosphopantetheinyl transferase (holo-ACP synthase)